MVGVGLRRGPAAIDHLKRVRKVLQARGVDSESHAGAAMGLVEDGATSDVSIAAERSIGSCAAARSSTAPARRAGCADVRVEGDRIAAIGPRPRVARRDA